MLYVGNSEQCERGVGAGVNDTLLSETLQVVGVVETAQRAVFLRKKPMNLCAYDSEQRECGVGTGKQFARHVVYYESIK